MNEPSQGLASCSKVGKQFMTFMLQADSLPLPVSILLQLEHRAQFMVLFLKVTPENQAFK